MGERRHVNVVQADHVRWRAGPDRGRQLAGVVVGRGQVQHDLEVLVGRVELRDQRLGRAVGGLAGPEVHRSRWRSRRTSSPRPRTTCCRTSRRRPRGPAPRPAPRLATVRSRRASSPYALSVVYPGRARMPRSYASVHVTDLLAGLARSFWVSGPDSWLLRWPAARHPHPHGASVAVVPLEVGDGHRRGGIPAAAAWSGWAVLRGGLGLRGGRNRAVRRGERPRRTACASTVTVCPMPGTSASRSASSPGVSARSSTLDVPRLVGLLEAVHKRPALHRHGAPQRVDAPARVGQPRRDVQVAAQDVTGHPVPPDDQVAAVGGVRRAPGCR